MTQNQAVLISGCSCNSLGSALAQALSKRDSQTTVLAIGHQCPESAFDSKVVPIDINLNPLDYSNGYGEFVNRLGSVLESTTRQLHLTGIRSAILTAGVYDGGAFCDSQESTRQSVVGVNICGKVELLHAILSLNSKLGYDSSQFFTLVDIGSLHGMVPSPNRALYSATKAFGLDLCVAINRGTETCRTVYVAPGPIDTQMLHHNYWVYKEKGSATFFQEMRLQPQSLYEDIFIHCKSDALTSGAFKNRRDIGELTETLSRYKARRKKTYDDSTGILRAEQLAEQIVNFISDPECNGVVCVVTAPKGQLKVSALPFSKVRYDQLPNL